MAKAAGDAIPSCAHWTNAFVFTEFMDRASVKGGNGNRLYLRPANPWICSLLDPRDCQASTYVIPKDIVTIGHTCEDWAHVMFERGRSRSMGWVELARVERLKPDKSTLDARKKWFRDPEGPPLVLAAIAGDTERVRKYASADPAALSNHGATALYRAAREEHRSATAALLDLGVDPLHGNRCQDFIGVATSASVDIIDLFIGARVDVNCKTIREKRTPLMGVAWTNRGMEMVSRAMGHTKSRDLLAAANRLLAASANVNSTDVWGGSALRASIEPNNVDIAALLLNAKADVNNYIDDSTSIGEQRGNTTLLAAISWFSLRRDPTMIHLLLKHKVDVNFRNNLPYDEDCDRTTSGKCTFRGQTALTRAASEGYYTIVRLLLENGADPLLPRTDGTTPAEIACDKNNVEIAELIEKHVDKVLGQAPVGPCAMNWIPRRR